jgi:3-oxoacyl-[acyl-carrier-protein] synthase II
MGEGKRRIVITGMGVLTPLNSKDTPIENLVEEFWGKLVEGTNGVERLNGSSRIDLSEFPVSIGGLVKFDVSQYMRDTKLFDNKREVRQVDPFSRYALVAAYAAIADAGLLDYEDKERIGVIVGTGVGGLSTLEEQKKTLLEKGIRRVRPITVPMIMPNAASGNIAIKYGFSGPNYGATSACASAAHAIYDSLLNILAGKADIMVTGGSECAVTPLGFACFSLIRALSRNPDPDASSPFDKDRDGFVMAEGSGILVLEEYEHAKKRGTKIYAELLSAYASCDAAHITAPRKDGNQVRRAMRSALGEAGLEPEQIGHVNAHGTSTQYNDRIEAQAIIDVFGEHAFNGLLVSSTKSMTGHSLGATAAVEAIASICALREGIVPPTIHYKTPDPELADSTGRQLDYVPNEAREKKLEAVMSNSLGFGGPNCVLVFGKVK